MLIVRAHGLDAWIRDLGERWKVDSEREPGGSAATEPLGVSWRGMWDRVTRRGFITSILAAAGSLFRKSTVMAEEGGPGPVNAAPRDVDWDALRRRIKGGVVTANAPDFAAV